MAGLHHTDPRCHAGKGTFPSRYGSEGRGNSMKLKIM